MRVTRIDRVDSCWQIAAAWDCMTQGIPFRRTAWLLSWWNHFQSGRDLFVLEVRDQWGEVVGIAPWYIEHTLRHGRVVQSLGSGSVCSDYLGLLTTREHQQQVTEALSQWLLEAAAGEHGPENQWDLLDLESVAAEDWLMNQFADQMESIGNHVHRGKAMSCWRVELPSTWEEFLAGLKKTHRKRMRRLERQFQQAGDLQLRLATTSDELAYGMRILVECHQQRQQSVGHEGCFADNAFAGFLHEAAERLLHAGVLRLYWLEKDGAPWAIDFGLSVDGCTYAYLGGMNIAKQNESPGHLLQLAILKRCLEEDQKVFDLLRGKEAYKSYWEVCEQVCFDYRIVPRRHTAQLRHQVWLAGDTMKQIVRTSLQLAGTR